MPEKSKKYYSIFKRIFSILGEVFVRVGRVGFAIFIFISAFSLYMHFTTYVNRLNGMYLFISLDLFKYSMLYLGLYAAGRDFIGFANRKPNQEKDNSNEI